MALARYRDRHSVAGRKSDKGYSAVLANVHRADLHAHRPLPADSELAQAVAVLARAQQDAVWERVHAQNKLRSHLREYFPGFLAAFGSARGGITRPEARVIWPPPPPRPTRPASPRPGSRACCARPAGSAASNRRPPGCTPPSSRSRCAGLPLVVLFAGFLALIGTR
jgi:hypothetical protein